MRLGLLRLLAVCVGLVSAGVCQNVSRPAVVNIGAVFSFNSTIGRVAKVAINAAVDDINSDTSVLRGTNLTVQMQDSSCNAFLGVVEALKFMETDIVAIVGPQSSVVAHAISHVANEFQVPLLSFSATDPTLSSLQYPFFVRATQSDLFQMAAIAKIVDYYQWRKVIAIFTDDDYGRNGIASLGDKLAERRCMISYKAALPPGATKSDIYDILVKVALMESHVLVVHANPGSSLLIFSVAKYLGMMGTGYAWIATDWLTYLLDSLASLDTHTMDLIQGVVTLRQHTEDSKLKSDFVSKWNKLTQRGDNGYSKLNSYGLYAYDAIWVVAKAIDAFFTDGGIVSFSSDPRLKDIGRGSLHLEAMSVFDGGKLLLDKIRKTKLAGVTGSVEFDSDGHLVHPAYDIINVVGTGLHTVGYWSNFSGLSVVSPEKLDKITTNSSFEHQKLYTVIWPGETITKPRGWVFPYNGEELRIGVPHRVSYKEFVSEQQVSSTPKGFCIDVFTAAVNLLPYPVPYRFISFGNGHDNPNYDDLVNMIAEDAFDAAIGDIAITTNRTRRADYTQPYVESGLVIITPINRHSSNVWAFLQPFTLQMWCVIGMFFLAIGAVVWILEHRINDEFRGSPRKQLVTIVWFGFSTLLSSHRENIVSTLGRVVLIILLFLVMIIQSSYKASLSSILTVQQFSSPIKGIDSLIDSNEPIGFPNGSFVGNYMADEMGISRSRLKALSSAEDYARALDLGPNNGGVAAVVDELPYVELFLSTQCNFATVGTEFTKGGWGFVFQRDSPLAVDMSTAILSLAENGEMQKIKNKWLSRGERCSPQGSEAKSDRLPLSSFWGLFLICGIACFLSLLIYFIKMLRQFVISAYRKMINPTLLLMTAAPFEELSLLVTRKWTPRAGEWRRCQVKDQITILGCVNSCTEYWLFMLDCIVSYLCSAYRRIVS
ncbi:glutamate receptor 3.1-like [Iris pallida]|uniref:Glutamate receptor n=1 Tax=Iris pallida TaxID=29817 RepID=A0AAX6F8H5_IRIPA|nr:glutamate receptor 3.1-like [Iris pallida]